MIRHLDLFSGIGGFSLAASWTGVVEPAGFCEIDPWCRRILAKHWPEVPQHDDITTLTGDVLRGFGRIDLVTGGFPCQPYSVAGNRGGDTDDRALWPQMARVIDECRPTYVLGENVPGLINMALDGVSADLEALGYTVRAVVVPAVAIDAPHRRDRLWIVAHANSQGEPTGAVDAEASGSMALVDAERGGWRESMRVDPLQGPFPPTEREESTPRIGSGSESLANSESSARRGIASGETGLTALGGETLSESTGKRSPESWTYQQSGSSTSNSDGEASQPRHDREQHSWPPEPGVGRVAHGIPKRVDRLRGLGNAIVPAVAYEILSVMLADHPRVPSDALPEREMIQPREGETA